MLDWNWYFSSLAQSTAAIVGIFGAFIITKILSNQSEYSQKKTRLKELIIRSQRLRDDAEALAFKWYVERTNKEELDDLREILVEGDLSPPEELYDRLNFSEYFPREKAIALISHSVELWNEKRKREEEERHRQRGRAGGNLPFSQRAPAIMPLDSNLVSNHAFNPNFRVAIEKERESIDFVLREIRSQIRTVSNFLDTVRSNPESSPIITYTLWLIIILFFAGVIYPLSFLPVQVGNEVHISINAFVPLLFSLRGALLVAVSIVFMTVVFMFFVINLRLRYSQSDVSELEVFTKTSEYSEFYGVMENNIKERQRGNEG
jgi:hypothetical protein